MTDEPKRDYWPGLYRGAVTLNVDPEKRGRLLVSVPSVLGYLPTSWAEPCTPLSGPVGPPMGFSLVPPIGTPVWVMFEGGDVNLPVWMGCRFEGPENVPPLAQLGNPVDPNIVIQSLLQHAIVVSDMPPTPLTGGIMLKSTTGAMIVVNDSGIYLNNGKGASITLIGPTINMNLGALTVI